jgi:hypothetical protein
VNGIRALAAFALVAGVMGVASGARASSTPPKLAVTVNDRHALGTRVVIRAGRAFVAIGAVGSALEPAPITGGLFETPTGSPLGEIFRSMRAGLSYDPDSREVTVLRGRIYPSTLEIEATATAGSKRLLLTTLTAGVAGGPLKSSQSSRTVSAAPLVIDGTVYAPLRELCEAVGAYVEMDAVAQNGCDSRFAPVARGARRRRRGAREDAGARPTRAAITRRRGEEFEVSRAGFALTVERLGMDVAAR